MNNIPRLHDIGVMCLKHRRSIGYIIQKLSDSVQGMYNPHYHTDDKELSLLVLKLDGPALLEILHRPKGFLSFSEY